MVVFCLSLHLIFLFKIGIPERIALLQIIKNNKMPYIPIYFQVVTRVLF